MAGSRLGIDPRELREGFRAEPLRRLMEMPNSQIGSLRIDGLMRDPMAPEGSEPLYTAMGSVQPPETFAAPMMPRTA
jgi:hypothetical protein